MSFLEKRSSTAGAAGWMILISLVASLILGWIPLIGPFIGPLLGGYVGGRKAGAMGPALIASLLPALLFAGFVFLMISLVTLMGLGLLAPLLGAFMGGLAAILILAASGAMIVGALVGGYQAENNIRY